MATKASSLIILQIGNRVEVFMHCCFIFLFQRSYKKELFDDATKHLHKTLLKTEVSGSDNKHTLSIFKILFFGHGFGRTLESQL